MAKIWKSEEFVWKREGFIKKSEEFLWKNDEFVWKSERIYMAQRYSKYRFFDVNCILSILFQVQLWGCPGKPKFQFHILSERSMLYMENIVERNIWKISEINRHVNSPPSPVRTKRVFHKGVPGSNHGFAEW